MTSAHGARKTISESSSGGLGAQPPALVRRPTASPRPRVPPSPRRRREACAVEWHARPGAPASVPGQHDRNQIGGSPFAEPEPLALLDRDDWFACLDRRRLKFVEDPGKPWCDLQSRQVRPG